MSTQFKRTTIQSITMSTLCRAKLTTCCDKEERGWEKMGGEAMITPSTAWVICHTEAKTYKCTKFEVFCFSHFRDISGNVKFQHGSHDPDHCYLVVSCDTKSNNSHGAAMDKIQQASVIPEIWLGPLKFKMIQVTRDHDPFKMVCYPWAGLPMVSLSLCTKFELFVHYEDMNDNRKCRNGIVWGG